MLDYSIGETDSLVLKAYRGAGFSWGLAQEAGNAAAWMAMHGLPAIDQFALLLATIDQQVTGQLTPLINNGPAWSNPTGQMCPVICGIAFAECDLQKLDLNTGLVLQGVQQPLIALPFVAHGAKALQTDLEMRAGDYKVTCGQQGQVIEFTTTPSDSDTNKKFKADIEIRLASRRVDTGFTLQQRAFGTAESIASLSKLAHRTYVPATEASRSGAGAGLLDND